MTRCHLISLLLSLLIICVDSRAQTPGADLSSHISWELEFPSLHASVLSTAAIDKNGDLWFVSDFPGSSKLVHIASDGKLVSTKEFPESLTPRPPAESSRFALGVLPSGTIGLLADYEHANGKTIYFDGAAFARMDGDEIGAPKGIASAGPEYKGFLALSDEHFLVMGDQMPLVLIRIDAQGRVIWRRTFPANWVLPSAAALDNGGACIASPQYSQPRLHIVQLDGSGAVQHKAEISARLARTASGPNGSCAILYDRGRSLESKAQDFFLTQFDASFKRQWTVPIHLERPWGGVFYLVNIADGYLVVAETGLVGPLFIAKYDFSGQLLWSLLDKSRHAPSLVTADGAGFYLIGAGLDGHTSLSVLRGR